MITLAMAAVSMLGNTAGTLEIDWKDVAEKRRWPDVEDKRNPEIDDGYLNITKESLGPVGSIGLYPVATWDRRYVVFLSGNRSQLYFQKLVGGKAKLVWTVRLATGKPKRKLNGAITKFLASQKLHVASPSRLTRAQRISLAANVGFGAYFPESPIGGGMGTYFLQPNGQLAKTWVTGTIDDYPISPEEKAAVKDS